MAWDTSIINIFSFRVSFISQFIKLGEIINLIKFKFNNFFHFLPHAAYIFRQKILIQQKIQVCIIHCTCEVIMMGKTDILPSLILNSNEG